MTASVVTESARRIDVIIGQVIAIAGWLAEPCSTALVPSKDALRNRTDRQ